MSVSNAPTPDAGTEAAQEVSGIACGLLEGKYDAAVVFLLANPEQTMTLTREVGSLAASDRMLQLMIHGTLLSRMTDLAVEGREKEEKA